MLIYKASDLFPLGYTDSDFQTDKDKRKSTSGCVFTLGGGVVIWRSVKQNASQTQPWKSNMWQPLRQPRRLYGSETSC